MYNNYNANYAKFQQEDNYSGGDRGSVPGQQYAADNCYYNDTLVAQQNSSSKFYTKIKPRVIDDSFNPNELDFLKYPNNISVPQTLPTINEPNSYEIVNNYVQLRSLDRDLESFANPASFDIALPTTLFDVVSIEIASAIIPITSPFNNEPYLYLKLRDDSRDLEHIYISNGDKVFGILALHTSNTSAFYNLDKTSSYQMGYNYPSTKSKLARLGISLWTGENVPVVFTNANLLDPSIQVAITLIIKTRQRKRIDVEDFRNTRGIFKE
jgi:hypothetical protein